MIAILIAFYNLVFSDNCKKYHGPMLVKIIFCLIHSKAGSVCGAMCRFKVKKIAHEKLL